MGHPDAELMRRWRLGDAAAFAAIVDRWQQPVARFLLRVVGRPDRVPDLCQGVFLGLLRARSRESGGFSTWLFQIALNVARDAARRGRNAPVPLTDVATNDVTDETCERRELSRAVAY